MPTPKIISTLFGQGELSIISDSEDFLRECAHLGFNTANISEIEKLPKNSIIFSFSNDAAKLTFDIAKNTKNKKAFFAQRKCSSLP